MGAIIMKLLEKNPDSRYPDGAALLKDLRAYREGRMRPRPAEDDDATIIDDATLMMNDAAQIVGAKPVSGTLAPHQPDMPEKPDATVVTPAADVPAPPVYKKHLKVQAGAGAGLLVVFFLIIHFSGGEPEKPAQPASAPTPKTAGDKPSPAQIPPEPAVPQTATLPETISPAPASALPASLPEAILAAAGGNTADGFSLGTDRDTYRIGDAMTFHFESRTPCYAVILGYTTQGDLVQIFPNHFLPGQFVQAGRRYAIPGADMEFDLKVFGPAGRETVTALVADGPFSLFGESFSADNPFLSFNESDLPQKERFFKQLTSLSNQKISGRQAEYRIIP
jgi:hypothetical protein